MIGKNAKQIIINYLAESKCIKKDLELIDLFEKAKNKNNKIQDIINNIEINILNLKHEKLQ